MLIRVGGGGPGAGYSPAQRRAVGQFATLTLIGVLTVLVIGGCALVLISRHRRRVQEAVRARGQGKGRAAGQRADPWAEAGRRAQPEPDDPAPFGADDDTVDLDPPDGPPSRG